MVQRLSLSILLWSAAFVGWSEAAPKGTPFKAVDRVREIRSGGDRAKSLTRTFDNMANASLRKPADDESLLIVFSDLDGTLIHYPEVVDHAEEEQILQLPPSSTGMVGIISLQTLLKCQEIRKKGVKFVLVSGMRSSTLLKRLPYLPKADAYCCEAGGRIFYPSTSSEGYKVEPVVYKGADGEATEAFYIKEDMEWRQRMVQLYAAGPDGFAGGDDAESTSLIPVPVDDRKGALWSFARSLMKQNLALDTKGYATCFRVNRKQQETEESQAAFDALIRGEIEYPFELSSSVNLGCVDFYPISSGKKQCCEYLAEKFSGTKETLSSRCVCICDDDNDLEMALACAHAYVPSISSESLLAVIESNPTRFTTTFMGEGTEGVLATEAALSQILGRIVHG